MSESDPHSTDSRDAIKNKTERKNWIKLFRIVVACVVALAIVYTAVKASAQLKENKFDLSQVQYVWWLLAIPAYVGTMLLSWIFWHKVLWALQQKPSWIDSLLAFFASQLGKYVPGKAMVVIIRTDMIRGEKVRTAPAAASVFVETLTWIFVGSVIGCLLMMFQFQDQKVLQVAGFVMALIAGFLTWPPVFRKIATRVSKVSEKRAEKLFAGLNVSVMSYGWLTIAIGWCFNALSLWLVLKGIPGTDVGPGDFSLTLACVTLASVAGFVSLLPGGLGVRELVMIPLLGSRFGTVTAVIAAIAIRLVWLAAELLTTGIFYVWRRLR